LPKKIRVYELARELGLTNKEALDICIDLGIGVKSHSSSIEDAQADRARRKADREGLRRAVQPRSRPRHPPRPDSGPETQRGRRVPAHGERAGRRAAWCRAAAPTPEPAGPDLSGSPPSSRKRKPPLGPTSLAQVSVSW